MMKSVGALLWVLGAIIFGWACFGFDPSVATDGSFGTAGRVVNIGRQQQQMLMALAGLAAFATGAIVHALGIIEDRFQPAAASRDAQPSAASPIELAAEDEPDAILMERYGVTQVGEQYAYGYFRYDRLSDAIAYARREAK